MLLSAIAVAAFVSTLAGGMLALGLRDKLHLILGFSAGAVIGVAFFDLLPESIDTARGFQSPAVILAWSALGFLSYLVLDRVLLVHGGAVPPRASAGALVLCAHSLLDGVAIGLEDLKIDEPVVPLDLVATDRGFERAPTHHHGRRMFELRDLLDLPQHRRNVECHADA